MRLSMRGLAAWVCLATTGLAGCGRLGFAERADADPDATEPATCWSRWLDGTIAFATPARLTELGTATSQRDPSLADDDLTLYFNQRVGTNTDQDVHVTTRNARTEPWQLPRTVLELNTTADENRVSSTGDGLLVVIVTKRFSMDAELGLARRTTRAESFGPVDRGALVNVSSLEDDHDAELTDDGLRVYFAPGGVSLPQRLAVASRQTRTEPFEPPVEIPIAVAVDEYIADPSVSPDERVLLFARYAATGTSLHYMTRADRDASFGAPRALTIVGPPASDSGGDLSRDGCELVFESNRNGGKRLHVARLAP